MQQRRSDVSAVPAVLRPDRSVWLYDAETQSVRRHIKLDIRTA